MMRRFPRDFQRVKPWGRQGDEKCDGYIRSIRTLCQVYAPERMESAQTVQKIEDDFRGASPYWQDFFETWAFVHNAEGLPPDAAKRIEQLHIENNPPAVVMWGRVELLGFVRELKIHDLQDLFGHAPSLNGWTQTGYRDFDRVLRNLERQEPIRELDLRPPPPNKIEYNQINVEAAWLLRFGMLKAHHVDRLISQHPDPRYGDEIAERLHADYKALKASGLPPGLIIAKLQQRIGGTEQASSTYQNAVLAVLAHFFATCDIFEREPTA